MNKTKENLFILGFGILLIGIILAIAIIRPHQKESETNTLDKTQTKTEMSEKINLITPENLFAKTNKLDSTLIILDLRTQDEYDFEHIAGSKNISIEEVETEINSDQNKAYALVDNGVDSSIEVILKSLDYPENVYYLKGGFLAWKENFYPTVSIGNPNSFIDTAKTQELTLEEVKTLLGQADLPLIIDLRKPENFNASHLPQAINIPLEELENQYRNISAGKSIFVYSYNTLEAFQGSIRLYDLGFLQVSYSKEPFENLKPLLK